MPVVEVDISGIKELAQKFKSAAHDDFHKELETYIDGIGEEFLRVAQEEIIRRNVMDSRNLLNSFSKGAEGNIWDANAGALTIEVGTNVYYAPYVEYGHSQQPGRFVPGAWSGGSFVYQPGAKTGMVLKASFVPGRHYFQGAITAFESIYTKSLEAKFSAWLNSYFG